MRLDERRRDDREPSQAAMNGDGSGGHLDELRSATERLLQAGDDAIDRALSGDSEAFLRASRQEGGQ